MFCPRDFQFEPNAPVVFIAGAATDPSDWTWLAEYIGGEFTVVAPDVRLNNRATPSEWASAAEDAFVYEAMRAGGQINIVAHGPGAIPALRFASRNPGLVRGLALIEPMIAGTASDVPGFRQMADGFQRFSAEGDASAATWWHTDYWHGKGAWSRTSVGLRQSMAFRTGATRRDIEAVLTLRISDADLAGVVCPVLILNGEDTTTDALQVSERLTGHVPFSRSTEIAGEGHLPHITAPHVTHPHVREFLVRIAQHWHDSAVPIVMAA